MFASKALSADQRTRYPPNQQGPLTLFRESGRDAYNRHDEAKTKQFKTLKLFLSILDHVVLKFV